MIIALPILFFSLLPTGPHHQASAETHYVSDVLIISVREGQDPEDTVVGYLRSATPVEILEETDKLLLIRTDGGLQGWVRKRFIVAQKPKAMVIDELKSQISTLENDLQKLQEGSDPDGLKQIMQGHQKEIQTLDTALKNEKKNSAALQNSLKEASAKYNQLLKKHEKNTANAKELASLKAANQALEKQLAERPTTGPLPMLSTNMKWFLIGSGVLILGFIIGRVVRRKPRYGY